MLEITLGYTVDGFDSSSWSQFTTESSSDKYPYADFVPPVRAPAKNQSLTSLSSRSDSPSVPNSSSAISFPESKSDSQSSQVPSFDNDNKGDSRQGTIPRPSAINAVQSESSAIPRSTSIPQITPIEHHTHVSRAALQIQHTQSLPDYHQQYGQAQSTSQVPYVRTESAPIVPTNTTAAAILQGTAASEIGRAHV